MAETRIIECGDALGISGVGDLYAEILMEMSEGYEISFDVSKIERIDAAALQMLYAYSKEAAKNGHALEWQDPSEAFIRSAELLGLTELMNLSSSAEQLAH